MISEFVQWFRSNEKQFKAAPLFSKIRQSEINDETVTPSMHKAHVGLVTNDLIVSFTVWDTGMCEIIFMDNLTSDTFVAVDQKFNTADELLTVLKKYGDLMMSGATFDDLKTRESTPRPEI